MIISGTGHRPHYLNEEYNYDGPLSQWIMDETRRILIEKNPSEVTSGMAIGYDTMLALVTLELNIPLFAAIPFKGQESKWPKSSQEIFHKILANSLTTTVIVCDGGYAGWKFIQRDKFMVDRADEVLACYNGEEKGGTYQTVKYANDKGKPITRINPLDCPFFKRTIFHHQV